MAAKNAATMVLDADFFRGYDLKADYVDVRRPRPNLVQGAKNAMGVQTCEWIVQRAGAQDRVGNIYTAPLARRCRR